MAASFKHHARRIRLTRLALSLALTVLFALQVLGLVQIPMLQRIDYIFYDLRMKATLPVELDDRILVVDIDEQSLAGEGRWPWSREKLSYLVDILFDYYRVKLLAFDVVFSEADDSINIEVAEKLLRRLILAQTPRDEAIGMLHGELASDARFAASLKDRPVVLGYFFSGKASNSPGVLPPSQLMEQSLPFARWLLQAESYGGNLAVLQAAARGGGFINTPSPDADGVLRSVPLQIRYQGRLYDSLALAVLKVLFPGSDLEYHLGDYQDAADARLESIRLAGFQVPVSQTSGVLVPYRAHQRGYRYVSATDVLNGTLAPEVLADKIVLIGATAAGLSDFYPTPAHTSTPGVEVHASILSGFLDQRFKSRPAFAQGWELLQVLLLGLVMALLFPLLHVGMMTLGFLLLTLMALAVNLAAWAQGGMALGLATPLALLLTLFGLQLIFGYFFEIRRKHQLGQVFGHYVPPELVEDMSHSEEEFSIGGISRELTVLFSDIRDFTSISETLDPQRLCALINEILTAVTREVHATRGTIDKYMGDAVMAFWGAPVSDEQHASHGVAAGLAMVRAIERLNAEFSSRGERSIRIGVGLNTGAMSVGNMGSEFRMAYTVMGDAVNLGSRLEGLTKNYGVSVIASQFTRAAAPGYLYRELDRVRVKGKLEPITIYEPIRPFTEASPAQVVEVEQVAAALAAYRAQDWPGALALLRPLAERYPEDPFYGIYLQRIAHYQEEPPPADWDGVYVFKTK